MYSIGEASRRSGVGIETIRYYERRGIVPAPARTDAGRRVYDDTDVRRLRFVRRCRDLGFAIPDIGVLLRLADGRDRPCAEVKAVGERHLAAVRSRITDLQALETSLSALIDDCAAGRTRCPALERLFAD